MVTVFTLNFFAFTETKYLLESSNSENIVMLSPLLCSALLCSAQLKHFPMCQNDYNQS